MMKLRENIRLNLDKTRRCLSNVTSSSAVTVAIALWSFSACCPDETSLASDASVAGFDGGSGGDVFDGGIVVQVKGYVRLRRDSFSIQPCGGLDRWLLDYAVADDVLVNQSRVDNCSSPGVCDGWSVFVEGTGTLSAPGNYGPFERAVTFFNVTFATSTSPVGCVE